MTCNGSPIGRNADRARAFRPSGLAVGASLALVLSLAVPAQAQAQVIVGDCNGDGRVTVDELVRGVNVVLGLLDVVICPSFDANSDGVVDYHRCNVIGATGAHGHFRPIGNSWWESM